MGMDMTAATEDKDTQLRAAAADTIVRELASYAVLFALSWALLNRDIVTRAGIRSTRRPVSAEKAAAMRAVSELQRAVSAYEHEHDRAPSVPGDGLYGARRC